MKILKLIKQGKYKIWKVKQTLKLSKYKFLQDIRTKNMKTIKYINWY